MVNLIKPSERFHQQIEPALDEYDPLSERLANGLARAIAVLSGHAVAPAQSRDYCPCLNASDNSNPASIKPFVGLCRQ
jgi:hypothetical protein